MNLPAFDFTRTDTVSEWEPLHSVGTLKAGPDGMEIEVTGPDPYIAGPPRDFPEGTSLWLILRLKPDVSGMGQIFYVVGEGIPSEKDSVRFSVRGGNRQVVRLPLPPLGRNSRFRFDPPEDSNTTVVSSLRFEVRRILEEPEWPQPYRPDLETVQNPLHTQSGDLEILQGDSNLNDFIIRVGGREFAVGMTRFLIGYDDGTTLRWIDSDHDCVGIALERTEGGGIGVVCKLADPDGAEWVLTRTFTPDRRSAGSVDVKTTVSVNRNRTIVFLPMLVVFPGAGSFGTSKDQGLFPGLEYLADEPSSSTADLVGPAANRRVPDSLKITIPLMAIQDRDRYLGLIWEPSYEFSALYDSPDRTFRSGGHVMGILFPGSNGQNRKEGELLPYSGEEVRANEEITLRAVLLGGMGKSVVPVVKNYVELRGLPEVPDIGTDKEGYLHLAAMGWLNSPIREGGLFHHALFGNPRRPHPAADAAVYLRWLADETTDTDLSRRLRTAAQTAIEAVPLENSLHAAVSHLRSPVVPLLYGHIGENLGREKKRLADILSRFRPDGTVFYRPVEGKEDYGRTHFEPHANGYTANFVRNLLESACLAGDSESIRRSLDLVRALNRYDHTVPRGAQTWEIPLHTPDILASAHLVWVYTRAYRLNGDTGFLERARYWAWTGVPFVYLISPTENPVGVYATIPVLGATGWVAPVWMGLPVQWCGLVYADALYDLAEVDPGGPWKKLADGITASGIQQTYPVDHPRYPGLLPDSYELRGEIRNIPAINPGTVQGAAVRFFRKGPLYTFRCFHSSGVLLHAPGAVSIQEDAGSTLAFRFRPGFAGRCFLLLGSVSRKPTVSIDEEEIPLESGSWYDPENNRLVLEVTGEHTIRVSF